MHQRKWLLDFFWNNFCYWHVIISGNFGVVSQPAWTDPYIQEPWTCTILPLSSFQHEELSTPSLLCCARPYELSFFHHIQDILCCTKEDSGFKTEKNIYPMKFIIHIVTILFFSVLLCLWILFFSLSLSLFPMDPPLSLIQSNFVASWGAPQICGRSLRAVSLIVRCWPCDPDASSTPVLVSKTLDCTCQSQGLHTVSS